ncbi:unnamed protein product [Trichobilharzia szidati]|nr:unnamed protein product [Trichobilharzia szidati]
MAFYEDLKATLPCVTQSSPLNWIDCQSTDTYPTDVYRGDITFSNLFSEDILVHSSTNVHPVISSAAAATDDGDDDDGDANMLCTLQRGTCNKSMDTNLSECDHSKKCRSYSEYELFPIKLRHYDDEDYKSHRHSLYPSKHQPGKHLISRKCRRIKEQFLTIRETDKTNNNNNFSSNNNLFNPLPCENSTDLLSSIPIEIDEQNTEPFITNLISSDYSHSNDEMSTTPITYETNEQFATRTRTTIIHNDDDKYSIISVMNSYQLDPASPSLADKACTLSQLAKSRRYIIDSWCILPVSNQKIHSNIFLSNDTILGKHSPSSASPSAYSSWSSASSSPSSSSSPASPSPSSLISSLSALNVNCDSSIYRSSLNLLKSSSSSYIHYRDHPMNSLDHIRKIRRRSKRRIRPLSSFFQPSLTKVSEEGSSISSSTDSGSDSLPSDTQQDTIKDNNSNDFKELQDLFPSSSISIYDYKQRHDSPSDCQSNPSNKSFEISPPQNLLSSIETSKINDIQHCGDTADPITQHYDGELNKPLEVTTHNLNQNNSYDNNDENNRDVMVDTIAGDHVISNNCDNDATEGDKSSRELFPSI